MNTNPNRKPLVLAADDDENAHLLLKHAFAKAGVKAVLTQVNDGSEVIRYLAGEGAFADRAMYPLPDLLLLDLKMPKVSGLGVLEHLLKHPLPKSIPVIMFSCSDAEPDVKRAYALGCHAYVMKPTSMAKLIDFVSAISQEFFTTEMSAGEQAVFPFSRFTVSTTKGSDAKPTPAAVPPSKVVNHSESPDMFRLLVEQVKDYAIFMLDTEGRVLSWNEGARRIKGYEGNDVIGRHFSIFYPQSDKDNEKPQFELRMALEMGRYEDEGWRTRKDGSKFWANVVITPLRDPDGKLRGFAKVTRDLTQRKIQEDSVQRLLESEERFRLLVDQVKDYAIFILDAKGNIASWNQGARRLKGYTADEIMGRHFSTFYTPEDIARDHPSKELSIAIREGRYEEEGWRVKKDGSRFWASVVITSLWDKRGNLTGFAKVTRDLTAKKEQEEALRRKTEELEAFAHTLSHDLRSPLRSVTSFAQILQTEAKGLTESEKGYLEKIVKSAQTMDSLIGAILELSQLSVAQIGREAVPLEEVVEESLRFVEADIAKTRAQIKVKKPLPVVAANRTLLLQIFSNLVGNALKFSRKGEKPRIEISAKQTSDGWEIHVKDDGLGIPEEFHESIFKAFDRGGADSGTDGTGIGLAVVKKAVERLGGNVSVRSRQGQGSDFTVSLSAACVAEPRILDAK